LSIHFLSYGFLSVSRTKAIPGADNWWYFPSPTPQASSKLIDGRLTGSKIGDFAAERTVEALSGSKNGVFAAERTVEGLSGSKIGVFAAERTVEGLSGSKNGVFAAERTVEGLSGSKNGVFATKRTTKGHTGSKEAIFCLRPIHLPDCFAKVVDKDMACRAF